MVCHRICFCAACIDGALRKGVEALDCGESYRESWSCCVLDTEIRLFIHYELPIYYLFVADSESARHLSVHGMQENTTLFGLPHLSGDTAPFFFYLDYAPEAVCDTHQSSIMLLR